MTKKEQKLLLKNFYTLKYIGFDYIHLTNFDIPSQSNLQLPNNLEELKNVVSNCHLCSFSKTRQNTLFGYGNKNANIMFVSLAPSVFEDESGDITYGNSKKMFENMAKNVLNISLEGVYMLNILKCIPNKDDIETEIALCKPYIKKQIDIIKPKIIVMFGDIHKYLLQDISSNIKVVSTYHPTFILRNPSIKKDVFEDLKKVKLLMESL
jgi:DNA polymerase